MARTKDQPTEDCSQHGTRERVIATALQLFADKGYSATSTRIIAEQASCNLASIRYHFHSKEGLYEEVVREQLAQMRTRLLTTIDASLQEKPLQNAIEDLIRSFAITFLEPLMEQKGGDCFTRLVIHESLNSRLPHGAIVTDLLRPVQGALSTAIVQLVPHVDYDIAQRAAHSVFGQLIQVALIHSMFRGESKTKPPLFDLCDVVDHVVRFSVGGIQACVSREDDAGVGSRGASNA